jgi:hypothetical protein
VASRALIVIAGVPASAAVRGSACQVAEGDHPPGSEPFDATLPEGFGPGEHGAALEAAASQAGERDGAIIAVRDVWTDNEHQAAWLARPRDQVVRS